MSRSKRAQAAQQTVAFCDAGQYPAPSGDIVPIEPMVRRAVAGTVLYTPETPPAGSHARCHDTVISVTPESTVEALHRLAVEPGGHLACLNFASAKNPGGGFLGGSEAQEESLARSSALYPCLLAAREYYERHRECGTAFYLDLAIWSPDVAFFRDEDGTLLETPFVVSVITSPAPNAGAIAQNEPGRIGEIPAALRRRAVFVLQVAAERGVKRLVLGAWGCGVFRNDPAMVAGVFADLLRESGDFAGVFEQVVFAIFDRSSEQSVLRAFQAAVA